jgi:hypothetical protein
MLAVQYSSVLKKFSKGPQHSINFLSGRTSQKGSPKIVMELQPLYKKIKGNMFL